MLKKQIIDPTEFKGAFLDVKGVLYLKYQKIFPWSYYRINPWVLSEKIEKESKI